jgi:hypothetical protein
MKFLSGNYKQLKTNIMKKVFRIVGVLMLVFGILNEVARFFMIWKTGEDIPPDGIIWNSFIIYIGLNYKHHTDE